MADNSVIDRAPDPPPKVAVIAVHGVAYHAPGASANAMADLLFSLPSAVTAPAGCARSYGAFTCETVQIALQPVRVWTYDYPPPATRIGGLFRFLQEASSNFAAYLASQGKWVRSRGATPAPGSAGNEFMRLLLRNYKGGASGNAYGMPRLKGTRSGAAVGGEKEVHIYEAYWADLARPKNTLLSFFFALMQLLLHLGSLSRLAIDTGAAENSGWLWRTFRACQEYAVRLLQIPIPLLNFILLITALSVLPQQIPVGFEKTTALSLAALTGVALGFVAWRNPARAIPNGAAKWALMPFGFAALGVAAAFISLLWVNALLVIVIEWWFLGAALLEYVSQKYEEIRKGTQVSGRILYVIAFIGFLGALAAMRHEHIQARLPEATLWTMEWILAALRLSWVWLFIFAIAAFALGSIAWRRLPKGSSERARAHAAVRTSRLALSVPTLFMLLLLIFLWGGVFNWVTHSTLLPRPLFASNVQPTLPPGSAPLKSLFLDPNDIPRFLPMDSVPEHSAQLAGGEPKLQASRHTVDANNYFAAYLVWSVGPGLSITLAIVGIATFLLIWWVLPSVMTERFPNREQKEAPRWSTDRGSMHMGSWLSRGLDSMGLITILMWSAIFLVPTIFNIWLTARPDAPGLEGFIASTDLIIRQTGKLTASLALLGLLVRYSSSALGIVLDVDNYLRTGPEQETPRAKIAERYVSLLRYIAAYRDEQGRPYGKVVIVAHSLGALISADLLRFLREDGDPMLAAMGYGQAGGNPATIPVTLFTMGNPLRQLLSRFFPYLYDWIRSVPDGSIGGLGPASQTVPEKPSGSPDPSTLGLQHWVSAYRSGDYIGRSLWVDEWYRRCTVGAGTPDQPVHVISQAHPPGLREEVCIGAGAHQHYWDDTAPDIAEKLNSLI